MMQPNSNMDNLLMIQQRIIKKSKIRDVWTFITMASVVIGLIPVIGTLVGIADLLWFIGFIVLYFSIKNDRSLLEGLINNMNNDPQSQNHNYNYNFVNGSVENWRNVFLNYQDNNVQQLLKERKRLESKRDRWTFIYMIVGFVVAIIFIIAIMSAASSIISSNPNGEATHASIVNTVKSMMAVFVILGLITFVVWITWLITYITSYSSIKRLEMNLQTMNFNHHNNDDYNQTNYQAPDQN